MVRTMNTFPMAGANYAVSVSDRVAHRHVVAAPAVTRGWLHDSVENWWALLVGAPPRPLI